MILQLSYYTITLFLATAILSILAVYVWHRRSVPGGTYFAIFMVAAAEWVFASAIEYALIDVSTKILFIKLTYIGAAAIPPLWLLFVMDYCHKGHLITRRRNMLLWVLPVIIIALALTNEYHGLIWSSIVPVSNGLGDTLIFNKGIGAWVVNLYSYAMVIPAYLLLTWKALRDSEKNYRQAATILLGASVVLLASIISQMITVPLTGIDLTPFAFAIMGIIFSWGVFRQQIFELLPVATEELIEKMADGMIVLNQQGAIEKINVTAQRMFGVTEAVVGQRTETALKEGHNLAECLGVTSGSSCEITISGRDNSKDRPRWIDVRVSHLRDESSGSLGTLILLRDITESKLQGETLRKSAVDRVKAERLANIGYYDWDLKTREAHVSEGCSRIFGFPAGTSSITYGMFLEKIHPEDMPDIKRAISALVSQGLGHSLEYRIILPDGSVHYVYSESEEVVKDETGAQVRQFGIVQDITERKQIEASLRKSEQDRVKAERMAHLGYYDWDLKRQEAHISEGCSRIFGFPAGTSSIAYEMFTGKIHPEDVERIKREIRSNLEQGAAHSLDFRIVLQDGSVRHIHAESEAPVKDTSGTLARQFGIVQDTTEYQLTEEALRLSKEQYKAIVETANEAIVIIDSESKLAFVNNRAVQMFGYTKEELLGHSVFEFIDNEFKEILRDNISSQGSAIVQIDYKLRCKNGESRWIIASSSPMYNDRGEITGIIGMLTDITDRKLANEQLKISLKEKEALLKEVHHRVKNNLQIITSLLSLQSNGIEDVRYANMIKDSQNRIKSMALVHELLYKSKDLSRIDISEYLNSLTTNISRSYSHSTGHVTLYTDIEEIRIDVDRAVPLGIIVTELVSNAYKYAFPEGMKGEIRVELHRKEKKIILVISDNGVGLPDCFQIEKTSTLGLQLVELLTQQIDGTLEIDNTNQTTFRVSLPY